MKDLKQFYIENMDTIRDLEDTLFDLSLCMGDECGEQSHIHEDINIAWNAIYNIRKITGDVERKRNEITNKANDLKGRF